MRVRAFARFPAFAALAVSMAACMTSPGNGEKICGGDRVVDFTGYALEPNERVTLETSSSPDGPFVALKTVTADDAPLTLGSSDRRKIYPWRGSARIATWSRPGSLQGTKHAYVRASQSITVNGRARTVHAYTFEAGAPYVACMSDAFDAGKTAQEAAEKCKSSSSPVARVDAPAISKCAVKKGAWEQACTSGNRSWASKRFIVTLSRVANTPRYCEDVPRNLGWTVSKVFDLPNQPICLFEWNRAWDMTNEDRDILESFAESREDFRNHAQDTGYIGNSPRLSLPAILPDCAPARATCALASCPSGAAKKLGGETHGGTFTDMSSGCPKCATEKNGMILVVLPPEYRELPTVNLTVPYNQAVLSLAPQGRQAMLVQPLSPAGQPITAAEAFRDPFAGAQTIPAGQEFTVTPGHWYANRYPNDVSPSGGAPTP